MAQNRIRRCRQAAGLKATQLAERAGWSRQTLWRKENDRSPLTAADAELLAGILRVDPAFLMGWSESAPEFAELGS